MFYSINYIGVYSKIYQLQLQCQQRAITKIPQGPNLLFDTLVIYQRPCATQFWLVNRSLTYAYNDNLPGNKPYPDVCVSCCEQPTLRAFS